MIDEKINKLYSPSQWVVRYDQSKIVELHGKVMLDGSDVARSKVPYVTFKYDESNEAQFQIFFKNSNSKKDSLDLLNFESAPIFIYLHGGYWQWGSIFASSYMSECFTDQNIVVVALGYELAPTFKLDQIVSQVEKGVAKILEIANRSNSKVYICGHSAGAHLASMMLYTDFQNKYNLKQNPIAGLILVSGVFNLVPILQTDINDNLKMDEQMATNNSPLFFKNKTISSSYRNIKVLIAYGEHDSPAFKEQSNDYHKLLINDHKLEHVKTVSIDNVDHFNVVENLMLGDYILTKMVFDLIFEDKL